MARVLSEETRAEIQAVRGRYPNRRSAALPALRAAQYQLGWLPPEAVEEVAQELDLEPNALLQLITFYEMFHEHLVGRYVLGVCASLSCYLGGSDSLLSHLEGRLGVSAGGTTPDGLFTLRTVECMGACDRAPAMMVNEEYHEKLTLDQVDRLLEELRQQAAGDAGTRGHGDAESTHHSSLRTQNAEPRTQDRPEGGER